MARAIFWGPSGHGDTSRAVRIAIGVVRNWAEGKGKVTPATRARSAAAIVRWEAMRAASKTATAAKNTSERKTAAILLATKLEAAGYSREDAARRGVELSARAVAKLDLADWTPDLHPRDPIGRFRAKWGAAKLFDAATDADKKRLSIPPAWREVHVSRDPGAPLLAVGLDAKGREQRIYSAAHHEKQAAAKFERIGKLHDRLPGIDARLKQDAKTNDTALAALLIRRMGLRPGSDVNTGAEKKAHGATNLKASHLTTDGGNVRLNFTGKKGVALNLQRNDPELARLLKGRQNGKGPDDRLLNTDDRKLRDYMKQVAPGVKPKDLRTYLGTMTAKKLVASMPVPKTAGEYRKQRREVGKQVSEVLGNTPTMALGSYIDPAAFGPWDTANAVK